MASCEAQATEVSFDRSARAGARGDFNCAQTLACLRRGNARRATGRAAADRCVLACSKPARFALSASVVNSSCANTPKYEGRLYMRQVIKLLGSQGPMGG